MGLHIKLDEKEHRESRARLRSEVDLTNDFCKLPRCRLRPIQRGLCWQHYVATLRLVRSGRFTWADLEARGKVLPPTEAEPEIIRYLEGRTISGRKPSLSRGSAKLLARMQ